MATEVYTNAKILMDGIDLSGDCNEASVAYAAEMLDGTTFGQDTRIRKGGLAVVSVSVKGFVSFGLTGPDPEIFNRVGAATPSIVTVCAKTPVVGEATAFSFKCIGATYVPGGAVGVLLPFTATFEGAGTV